LRLLLCVCQASHLVGSPIRGSHLLGACLTIAAWGCYSCQEHAPMVCWEHPPDLGIRLLGTQQRVLCLPSTGAPGRGALFPGVLLLLQFRVCVCFSLPVVFNLLYCYCRWHFQRHTNMCGGSLCDVRSSHPMPIVSTVHCPVHIKSWGMPCCVCVHACAHTRPHVWAHSLAWCGMFACYMHIQSHGIHCLLVVDVDVCIKLFCTHCVLAPKSRVTICRWSAQEGVL
jgi:hypothetical protein